MSLKTGARPSARAGRCLIAAARLARVLGGLTRGARLSGAVDVNSEKSSASYQGDDVPREVHGHTVQDLRRLLAPAQFEAAWAEGRAMTLDQALALAQQPDD